MANRSSSEAAFDYRAQLAPSEAAVDDDLDDAYAPQTSAHRHAYDGSTSSAILEALPLLRRPSIYLDRTGDPSLGRGRGPMYGSDDDGDDAPDGEPLVRVQSGVKRVEAITMLWTKRSLIIAYVRYSLPSL
jgi:hypothetical protein